MNDASAPPSTGLIAGKYQLVRLIGRGGMGSVWEARHVSLGTTSAIKFIEAEYASSQEARSRFDKEAKAAATIQSKHAIQIFDHGVSDDGRPYIVMELLQGLPLDKAIERQPMSLPDTAKMIQQVCRALARAHERGIVHRDLKPENIFLAKTPEDDEPIAKVLDFGIAKMQSHPGTQGLTSSTKTGAVLGTPFYMSPEQARGLRNVDHRADIWSLGVIAFKCVTGRLPFDGESVGDLLVKICTAPLPVPSQVNPMLPPNFDAWFARALDRDPERRFATVTELADALGFVAGLAPRSQYSGPQPSAAPHAPPGMVTPAGYAMSPVLATPPPGAMTNAPITAESTPGVVPSRGKVIAGSIFAAAVALGLVAGGVLYVRSARVGTGVVAASGETETKPPETKPAESAAAKLPEPKPAEAEPPRPAEPTAETKPEHEPKKPAKTTPKAMPAAPPPLPVPAPVPPAIEPKPAPLPAPAPAPTPTTSSKKANRTDPGY